jgi:hypothetical protein
VNLEGSNYYLIFLFSFSFIIMCGGGEFQKYILLETYLWSLNILNFFIHPSIHPYCCICFPRYYHSLSYEPFFLFFFFFLAFSFPLLFAFFLAYECLTWYKGCVHTVALSFTLKKRYLIAKDVSYGNSNIYTIQKYNLQKNPLKETKNPSRRYLLIL